MDYENMIIRYMENHQGYITNKEAIQLGVPTVYLTRMMNKNKINKVERGIYMLPTIFEDNLYIYYLRYNKIVYSGQTALVINEMSNTSLRKIEANVPHNYNTHRINDFKVNRVSNVIYNLGKEMIETEFGNKVPTYNKERVLCDIYSEDYLDTEALNYAIKIAKMKKIDYEHLYEYSIALNVYEKIKFLLEIRDEY